jgi:signal transduction histidine kinase
VIVHEHTKYGVGFLALLAPVIVLHVYLIYYEQATFAHDQESKAFAEERERLLRQEADAADRERTKIAADLHDGVVQDLTGMQLQLYNAASQLRGQTGTDASRDELVELLEESATQTREAMKDLRTLIIDLVPPTFRREGLQAALLEVLRTIAKQGTNTDLEFPETLRLRKDRSELIFLVAQEMLRNVAAHAHAKNVIVQLTTEDGSAILSIQDDGRGFTAADIERSRANGHLGSSAAVDRVEAAGGTLTTDSEPGRGTLVVLTLPIE